jgi:hypothetical protein
MKKLFVLAVITVLATGALFAQKKDWHDAAVRPVIVFVYPIAEATGEEQEYFNNLLVGELSAKKIVLANEVDTSDYYIKMSVSRDDGENVLQFEIYRTSNQNQMLLLGDVYTELSDIAEQNSIFTYVVQALGNIPEISQVIEGTTLGIWTTPEDISWMRKWLYLGIEPGFALGILMNTPDSGLSGGNLSIAPVIGIPVELQFISRVGTMYFGMSLQTGAYYFYELVDGHGSSNVRFPLELKVNLHPNPLLLIAPHLGASYNMFMDDSLTTDLPLGWTAGVEIGAKLDNGTGFVNLSFFGDFTDTRTGRSITDNAGDAIPIIYHRYQVQLSAGYKWGLIGRE